MNKWYEAGHWHLLCGRLQNVKTPVVCWGSLAYQPPRLEVWQDNEAHIPFYLATQPVCNSQS